MIHDGQPRSPPSSLSLPELVLAVGALALILVGAFQGRARDQSRERSSPSRYSSSPRLAAVLQASAKRRRHSTAPSSTMISRRFMKVVTLLGAAATLAARNRRDEPAPANSAFEFPILVLLVVARHAADDLGERSHRALSRPRAAEPRALRPRRDRPRQCQGRREAGLKYFVLGALSSGMLLYGASLIYGFTGTSASPASPPRVKAARRSLGLMFGLVFLLAGLAFKISAVPFHMWTPDVYEGAPTPVTAFFAAAPKIAAMALHDARRSSRPSAGCTPTGSRSSCSSRSPRWCSALSRRSARATSSG